MSTPLSLAHPARDRWTWGLVLLALALRLAWGLTRPADPATLAALPDQNEYLQIARNVLDGRGFVFFDERFADTVSAYRTPGYPAFLAALGAKVTLVRVAQAFLDASIVLAAVLLAARAGVTPLGRRVTALLVALHPYLIYFSATVLSETLFAAMLAWGMLAMTDARRRVFVVGAALLLTSIYVRPSAVGLPVLLGIGAALVRPVAPRRSFWAPGPAATFLVLTFLTLLPWAVRNRAVVGAYVFTTTNTGITLYDGLNPLADGSSDQLRFVSWPDLKFMGEVERSEYFSRLARDYALDHPKRVAQLAVKKLARTWSPVPLSAQFGQSNLNRVAGAAVVVPLFVLVLVALRYRRLSRSWTLYLLLPALYFSLAHAVTVGALRYRVPADVPLAVLAGAALPARRPVLPDDPVD